MSWLAILAVAGLAFLGTAVLLKLPRHAWALFGAALLFGLAGYALQGSPGVAASPRAGQEKMAGEGELMVAARREFYDVTDTPSRFVVTADAFTRRGQYGQAARFLHNAIRDNPGDDEAWLALGMALVEHAEGQLTPASLYAFSRAEQLNPANPAPTYFLGLNLLRARRPAEARALWAEILAKAPADAPWRAALADRIARLDGLMAAVAGQATEPANSPQR